MSHLRGQAWSSKSAAAIGTVFLAAVWLGAQAIAWQWRVSANWRLPSEFDGVAVIVMVAGVSFILLWIVLRKAGEFMALEQAATHVILVAVSSMILATFVGFTGSEPPPLSILAIAVSPLVRRIVITAVSRPKSIVALEVSDLLVDLQLQPGNYECPAHVDLIEVVGLGDLDVGPSLGAGFSRRDNIRRACLTGSSENLVLKKFDSVGISQPCNPTRVLAPYRELLSRINSLTPSDRQDADRVLLWPRAVVADGDLAVGVLYDPISVPFLRMNGDAQTGSYLAAENATHSLCQEVDGTQRGVILRDIVRAHELLHKIDLAHGDTAWTNFVYGVDFRGIAHGMLIDIDSASAFDDPQPILLDQRPFQTPRWMRPARRDEVRVASVVSCE